jgi:hypothetical protein
VTADARGWRIALLPDALVNRPDVLSLLDDNGYGLLQLPPPGDHSLLLSVIADQVAEYSHHGYAVVAISLDEGDGLHWRSLAPLLRNRSVPLPPRHILTTHQQLALFLASHDLTLEEQRRWRV